MPSYAIAEHHDPVRHPLALIDAATPVDALAEYVVGEGFADPRETAREADPEWFYALEAGDAVGCAFTNTELVAFPAELVRGGGAMTHRYIARGGRVYVRHADGREEEAATALSANGRDLERHARALDVARYQQSILRLRVPSEADRVRVALHDDPTVDNETYGRLVEEAAEADERHSWKAEEPDRDVDELDTEVLKEIADDAARPIEERRAAWRAFNRRLAPQPEIPVAPEEELELRFARDEEAGDALDDAIAEQTGLHPAEEPNGIDTAPCEVCGDPVRAGLRYMAGPFAGRMFCESHDPLRGGPRSGYPELEGGGA